MKWGRVVALAAAGPLLFVLAGCSSGNSGDETSTPSASSEQATTAPAGTPTTVETGTVTPLGTPLACGAGLSTYDQGQVLAMMVEAGNLAPAEDWQVFTNELEFALAGDDYFEANVPEEAYLGGDFRTLSIGDIRAGEPGKLFTTELLLFVDAESATVAFEHWGPGEPDTLEQVSSRQFGDGTDAVSYSFNRTPEVLGYTLVFRAGQTVAIVSSSAAGSTPALADVEDVAQALCEQLVIHGGG